MIKPLRLIPDDTQIDFIKLRFVSFGFFLFIFLSSLVFIVSSGLNFGIDFRGGTLVEVFTDEQKDISALRSELNGLGYGQINIQEFGDVRDLLIRIPAQDGGEEAQQKLLSDVRSVIGEEGVDYRRVEFVGPQVGSELIRAGLLAITLSVIGILLYIWFRFEWQYGLSAIIALVSNFIFVIGLFALTQLEFNLSTVAAVLMIIGYSINDTVVVFDRVRENLRRYKKRPMAEVFNLSVNQALARSILTSLTTLLALFALYAFGGQVIRDFTFALLWGIGFGALSSLFLATPLLLYMRLPQEKGRKEDEAL